MVVPVTNVCFNSCPGKVRDRVIDEGLLLEMGFATVAFRTLRNSTFDVLSHLWPIDHIAGKLSGAVRTHVTLV